MDNYSLSDVAAATRGSESGGFGGGGFMGIFGLLILLGILGGGDGGLFGGGNKNGSAVTEADLCNANSFNDLKSGVRDISGQLSNMNVGLTKGICDLGYTTLGSFNALERQLADCCCTTQRAIDGVKFDMANYSAATNANVAAWGQKILDKMSADQAAALQARVNQLEMQQAMCGVVRYPMQTTYATNCNPFFGGNSCGCACG